MKMPVIALVGMSCRYPDARSPDELWENVLARRRAFRRIPPERLRLDDYFSDDPQAADTTYCREAALIEGYEFDRVRFRVAGSTFRAADMAHWLALDVAADALADAGFVAAEGLPKDACGVLVGNSLTGEFSRANLMRLRWPYVRRVVDAALADRGWSAEDRHDFLDQLQQQYKSPFPEVNDDTLAGGLSNTIAGRICNHFDLRGGGYTVDGACASSLLAVATACSALRAGDLDVAVAGGVDLSLDPFELVGFSRLGALAAKEMRVYDARSDGFWPGEGCGFLVLMRHDDALRQHRRIYALIRGWGISSDGSGGITRPEVDGQMLALRRAYRRAGFGIETVPYFEGHGTGTAVGDPTELRALSQARRGEDPTGPPAVIGSIKANIGHTKAAAGVAGLIKATKALQSQVLPPHTGWQQPHPVLEEEGGVLRLLEDGEPWPEDLPLRAGVSAMGFGGINAHLVLEGTAVRRHRTLSGRQRTLLSTDQDAELFLIAAADREALRGQVDRLLSYAARLSRAELLDLAAQMAETLQAGQVRAAIVASDPAELADGLRALGAWLAEDVSPRWDMPAGVMLGAGVKPPVIGFLFPGQGSPSRLDGGAWSRRFETVADLYARAQLPAGGDVIATEVAQPAIVAASMAGLRVLDRLGIEAAVGMGHSLGELSAYGWAGALDEAALLRLAAARGRAIAEFGRPGGAMASISAGQEAVEPLLQGRPIVVAGLNSPEQTVVSGEAAAVDELVTRARAMGQTAVRLRVSHAFHSPLVADSAPVLASAIAAEHLGPLMSPVVSTVTGNRLRPDDDLGDLLFRQMTSPVRFLDAANAVAEEVDLWIEVGPGNVLCGIAGQLVDTPRIPIDVGGRSFGGLLRAVGAAFVLGAAVNHRALFEGRFSRPFDPNWQPRFFVNPCELAPKSEPPPATRILQSEPEKSMSPPTPAAAPVGDADASALEVVRRLAAQRAELPLESVGVADRLLNDLHLSSLAVSQLVVDAARALDLPPPASPADSAGATVGEVARALQELADTGTGAADRPAEESPQGVDAWTRVFSVELVPRSLPHGRAAKEPGAWHVIAPPEHPLRADLQKAFEDAGQGRGVVVCLPPVPDQRHVELLLGGAREVLAAGPGQHFVLVQHGGGAAAFARSLHLEAPQATTCVVDVPLEHPQAVDWVLAESRAAVGYCEAHYDDQGVRREAVLRLLPMPDEPPSVPLDADDVLLVTGGGKGIAAECAFSLARETGVRLALLGRSRRCDSDELAANLQRMEAAGVRFEYASADVTDRDAVHTAVRELRSRLGPITAVLHGAGRNVPRRLDTLDEETFRQTLQPKVDGARNVLSAVDPSQLRLLITFGSIIARSGMRGQADYAVANEWLTRLTERWQSEHPHCRCLAVEWSVWSGVGMGERLGALDALRQQGITPITLDEGVRTLHALLGCELPVLSTVVTGRFGQPPTLRLADAELPLLRFLERPRVHVPGVELVVEADLSADTDPYLMDHIYQGVPLLPAVMGMEAMAQVAMALTGCEQPPTFENVRFDRPVVVPENERTTIRVAALLRKPGVVEAALRSRETGFQTDHFRATCRFDDRADPTVKTQRTTESMDDGSPLPIDPHRDLYGGILFHSGRFRRLGGYRRLRATQCVAEITPGDAADWFGRYLPQNLVLGDAAVRDAAIHAVQACIPHGTLLPIGVDRLVQSARPAAPVTVYAKERSQQGNTFVYDLEVTDADGRVCERWEGLRLRRVGAVGPGGKWVEPLLGPYIERRLGELIPGSATSVIVQRNGAADRRARSHQAIELALGHSVAVHRRPDGKPEVACDEEVSVTHANDLTMAVAGPAPIACDAELLAPRRPEAWRDLLGPERDTLASLITAQSADDRSASATRVWAAAECLKKAGAGLDMPLVLRSATPDGWVLLASGPLTIATWVAPLRNEGGKLAVAVLVGDHSE